MICLVLSLPCARWHGRALGTWGRVAREGVGRMVGSRMATRGSCRSWRWKQQRFPSRHSFPCSFSSQQGQDGIPPGVGDTRGAARLEVPCAGPPAQAPNEQAASPTAGPLDHLPRRGKGKDLGSARRFRLNYTCSFSSSAIKNQKEALLAACRAGLGERSLGHVTGHGRSRRLSRYLPVVILDQH